MKEDEVLLIDLAPKLKRPLSLWNPLDYLRLLFWAFFFPQAIRWYVETFRNGNLIDEKKIKSFKEWREYIAADPVLRRLHIQALFTTICIPVGICLILNAFGLPIDWGMLALAVAVSVAEGVVGFVAFRLVDRLMGGVAGGVAIYVAICVVSGLCFGLVGVVFSVPVGVETGAAVGIMFGVMLGTGGGVTVNLGFAFGYCLYLCVVGGVGVIVMGDLGVFVAVNVAIIVFFCRVFEYMISSLYFIINEIFNPIKRIPQLGRLVFYPLPGVQKQLEQQLSLNWDIGVKNANQYLAYTFQFIPVVNAVKNVLGNSSNDMLLSKANALTVKPFDWRLIRFGSADLYETMKLLSNYLFIFRNRDKYRNKLFGNVRLDTPAHAACAGFWLWHNKEASKAVNAFHVVRELSHGAELYNTSLFIANALQSNSIQAITSQAQKLDWLNSLPDPELRPGTLQVLHTLKSISADARVALHAHAPLNRSTAINRAVADLIHLIDTGHSFCPEPEWPLLLDIALKWKEIVSRFGGVIGEEILRQPVLNPYEGYSGLPVTGVCFVGRADIIHRIKTHWVNKGLMPVLILFGHRRMGKTSILRYLVHNANANNIYVYLDMQNAGWVEHTGQLLQDFAEAVYYEVSKSGSDIGPCPNCTDCFDLDSARRSFNALLLRLNEHMTESKRLILAIDEFELIEQGIHEKRINPGVLAYLRSLNQQYPWLGLIFAGLHTLDEMGRDYQSAFYGQAEYIRVSYLTRSDAFKLITQPHPDFSLEYEDSLIDEIYRLTFGQPYLVQRLCWELVNRWNERFLAMGETCPRVLTLDDLPPVLSADFFRNTGYYFQGVWSNATAHEKHLLRILATSENKPLSLAELTAEAIKTHFPIEPSKIEETINLLKKHDIITETGTGFSLASELMRQYIQKEESWLQS